MRIGIDFDNTIACYDGVFHAAAVERGLIDMAIATDKTSVRDHLRALGRDDAFTALQGYVYGPGMKHVALYAGLVEALDELRAAGHQLCIVSHKTRKPFAGPVYDLHEWAWWFLRERGLAAGDRPQFAESEIFLEETKQAKVARIAALECDVFVDDLPEILAMSGFPASCRAILFDPEGHYPGGMWQGRTFEICRDWPAIAAALLHARGPS